MNDTISLIDSKTVADLLCIKVSTLYSWMHYNQLPSNLYRKLGRKKVFIKEEVMKWFLDGAKLNKYPVRKINVA